MNRRYLVLAWLLDQIAQVSTWRGIVALLTGIGILKNPQYAEHLVGAGMLAVGALGAIFPDEIARIKGYAAVTRAKYAAAAATAPANPQAGFASLTLLACLVAFLVGLGAGFFYFDKPPQIITRTQNVPVKVEVPAPPAAEVVKVQTEYVPVKNCQVEAYQPVAKKSLNMPSAIAEDPVEHVLTSSTVKTDEHPQTVTTVFNDQTGKSEVFVMKEPLPWLAFDHKQSIAAYYGIKNGTEQALRLEYRADIAQIKAIHLNATAAADLSRSQPASRPDYFVGIGASYNF